MSIKKLSPFSPLFTTLSPRLSDCLICHYGEFGEMVKANLDKVFQKVESVINMSKEFWPYAFTLFTNSQQVIVQQVITLVKGSVRSGELVK